MRQRGSIPLALLILIGLAVILVAGLAVCGDALFEDEDEVNDLGAPAWMMDRNEEPCQGQDSCQGRGDCYQAKEPCEDNDLSPSFQDSPVDRSFNPVICILPDSCRFGSQPEEGETP